MINDNDYIHIKDVENGNLFLKIMNLYRCMGVHKYKVQ